eukprot:Selendium_serpulae@DN6010_c4_g1_i1.p1
MVLGRGLMKCIIILMSKPVCVFFCLFMHISKPNVHPRLRARLVGMSRAGLSTCAQFGLMTPEQLYASIRALDQFAITVLPALSAHDAQLVLHFAATFGASHTPVPLQHILEPNDNSPRRFNLLASPCITPWHSTPNALPSADDDQRHPIPFRPLLVSPCPPIRQPPPNQISMTSSVACNRPPMPSINLLASPCTNIRQPPPTQNPLISSVECNRPPMPSINL